MMCGVPLETCWAFNKLWNNKFYYKLHLVGISTESYYDARIHEYQKWMVSYRPRPSYRRGRHTHKKWGLKFHLSTGRRVLTLNPSTNSVIGQHVILTEAAVTCKLCVRLEWHFITDDFKITLLNIILGVYHTKILTHEGIKNNLHKTNLFRSWQKLIF